MSLLAVPIIAVLALALVILVSIVFFYCLNIFRGKIAMLTMQNQSTNLQVEELQSFNDKLQEDFDVFSKVNKKAMSENYQVSQQLEHRIKQLQQKLAEQQHLFMQWQEAQGQDKFYSRAIKLAEKGADIEEIVSECELPRAEVEMLLSVYKHRNLQQ
jgi:cell shape-determining protein MreC